MSAPGLDLVGVLRAHAIVYENDGGDYGGRSWFECLCDHDNVLNATEYSTKDEHRAHLAAAIREHVADWLGGDEVLDAVENSTHYWAEDVLTALADLARSTS